MKNNKKLNTKLNNALVYKFSELQSINKLKKLLNLIDFTDATNQLAFCYQNYADDEAYLQTV